MLLLRLGFAASVALILMALCESRAEAQGFRSANYDSVLHPSVSKAVPHHPSALHGYLGAHDEIVFEERIAARPVFCESFAGFQCGSDGFPPD